MGHAKERARRLTEQSSRNYFHVQGKVADNPVKYYDNRHKLCSLIKVEVEYDDVVIAVPVVVGGTKADVVATLYRIGDVVDIKGMFGNKYGQLVLIGLSFDMIEKNKEVRNNEIDMFQSIVSKYSIRSIGEREDSSDGGK